jgi:hypothetical protein
MMRKDDHIQPRKTGSAGGSASAPPPITPTPPLPEPGFPSVPQTARGSTASRVVRSPLLLLWVLGGVGVVGGIVEWLFLDGLPWEGLGAAGVIAGVTKLAARARGMPAWPWQDQP